jgi:CheY-like chemotaxis protein
MSISEARTFRVLVVDDNDDAARVLALLLRKGGHDVQTARNGAEALRLAAEFHPDCIVSDIGMPGVDGYELARRIRSDPQLEDTPLIALTAYEDADRILEAGFNYHLVKPAKLTAIVPLIAEVQALRARLKQVELTTETQSAALGTVKELVHEVKDEVTELKAQLKEEVAELKSDLKEEVEELKQELRVVKEVNEELKRSHD